MDEQTKEIFKALNDRVARDAIWALRGKAIAAYAKIEWALCSFLSSFGNMEMDVANVIYYQLNNARTAGIIISKLKRMKLGDQYSGFWGSLEKIVKKLNQTRNNIVHWAAEIQADSGGFYTNIELVPSGMLNQDGPQRNIDAEQLEAFIKECEIIAEISMFFVAYLIPGIGEKFDSSPKGKSWRDIFQQPIVYPPPKDHPLFRNPPAPESPPPPSGESPQSPPS